MNFCGSGDLTFESYTNLWSAMYFLLIAFWIEHPSNVMSALECLRVSANSLEHPLYMIKWHECLCVSVNTPECNWVCVNAFEWVWTSPEWIECAWTISVSIEHPLNLTECAWIPLIKYWKVINVHINLIIL